MLQSERTRLRQLTERETRGENFWSSHFDQKVRVKLLYTPAVVMAIPSGLC